MTKGSAVKILGDVHLGHLGVGAVVRDRLGRELEVARVDGAFATLRLPRGTLLPLTVCPSSGRCFLKKDGSEFPYLGTDLEVERFVAREEI